MKDSLIVWNPTLKLIMSRSRQYWENGKISSPLDKDLIWIPHSNNDSEKPEVNIGLKPLYSRAHVKSGHGSIVSTHTYFRFMFWSAKVKS